MRWAGKGFDHSGGVPAKAGPRPNRIISRKNTRLSMASSLAGGEALWHRAGPPRAQLDEPSLVAIAPVAHLPQDRFEAASPHGEIVFHARRDHRVHRAADQAVFLQLAQLAREQPLGYGRPQPPEARETLGSRWNVEE